MKVDFSVKADVFKRRAASFIKKHANIVPITAGALMALPFVFGALFFLTYIFLAFYYVILLSSAGKKYKFSFLFFFSYYLMAYGFFTSLYPIDAFAMGKIVSIAVILLIWSLSAAIHALITSFVMTRTKKLCENVKLLPFAASALWIADEWFLGIGGFAFPWASTALSQSYFLIQVQTVSLFGCFFISLAVSLTAFCAGEWIRSRRRVYAFIAASVYAADLICGAVIYFVPRDDSGSFSAAVVQGNVGTSEKWIKENAVNIYNTYVEMADKAAANENVKLVLLPESAIPVYFVKNGIVHKALADIASKYGVTVMFGSLCQEDDKYYNSVLAIYPDGSVSSRYDKQKLVPLIESLPYDDILGYSSLLELLPFFSDESFKEGMYQKGKGSVLIELPDGTKVTPAVCYDSAFPSVIRDGVMNGAGLITIVSNDSWYHDGPELYQHRDIAVLRSIETGRYTVRAANTGISCIIDDKGRIVCQTLPLTEDTVVSDVKIIRSKTLYTVVGDVPLYLAFLFILIMAVSKVYKKTVKKNNNAKKSGK